MATTRDGLLVDPYGRSGPYGETLGCVLGAFKSKIVGRAVSAVIDQGGIERLGRVGGHALAAALERFCERRVEYCETLVRIWPRGTESPPRDVAHLAGRRWKQLRDFLDGCKRRADSLAKGSDAHRSRTSLAGVIGSLFWPYYFVAVDGRDGQQPYFVTWMPPASLLSRPCFGFWSTLDGTGTTPFHLYPTIAGLLSEEQGATDPELRDLAAAWLDVGYSGEGIPTAERNDLNIGHVQALWPLARAAQYHEDVAQVTNEERRHSTQFSDAFYLNASGLYLDAPAHRGGRDVTGRLIICAAGSAILPALATFLSPGRSIEELGPDLLAIWQDVGGTEIARQLRDRYDVVVRQLLPGQADMDHSFLVHTLRAPAVDARMYIELALKERNVKSNLERARRQLKTLKENADTLLAVGRLERFRSATGHSGETRDLQRLDIHEVVERAKELIEVYGFRVAFRADVGPRWVDVTLSDALALVLVEFMRNALDEIRAMESDAATLGITTRTVGERVVVEVRNTARAAAAKAARTLNSQRSQSVAFWGLSRKGSSHYGIGSQQAQWIVKALGGSVTYSYDTGEFVVAVGLPTGPEDQEDDRAV